WKNNCRGSRRFPVGTTFETCALTLVQGDTGAHPGFFDVEIDAHHLALTHSDKIVDQRWIAVALRPNKHHANFGLRFLAIDSWHKRGVIDFPLQNPFARVLQSSDLLVGWLHVHAVTGKRVKRFQNVRIDLFPGRELGVKKLW